MIIKGLEANGYYTNNPLYIEVSELVNTKYIEVTLYYNGVNSVTYKLYSDLQGKVLVNIASMVRVMLPLTSANNDYTNNTNENTVNELTIKIKETKTDNTTTEQSFIKKFVRGGKIGNLINITSSTGVTLVNSTKLPIWKDRPVALYYMNSDLVVRKLPINATGSYFDSVHNIQVELQTTRYTDGVYIKFLNSLGGYSYWNFERSSTKLKTDNIGYYATPTIAGEVVNDMGQEINEEQTVESVVKAEYIGILQDLITSSEVYKYDGDNNWERIILDGNSITINPVKKVYDVSISFKRHNTFTPTTLI
ncbi:hypothetical protein [Empedobacter sp. 189-2]|uniref:hypothetical protein n=1 Tax=Empedobacter sp. 189-2 TaxID=2746724 RepID=UPI002576B6A3|nr:hypothetical protein [Empedobacter sp. 189-2]MDM1542355.1 hypothetical protein [Empedobacter sp. 189-2]